MHGIIFKYTNGGEVFRVLLEWYGVIITIIVVPSIYLSPAYIKTDRDSYASISSDMTTVL